MLKQIELSCNEEEYNKKWERYFNTGYDSSKIVDIVKGCYGTFLHKAVDFG